jgi:hypothetical protein
MLANCCTAHTTIVVMAPAAAPATTLGETFKGRQEAARARAQGPEEEAPA